MKWWPFSRKPDAAPAPVQRSTVVAMRRGFDGARVDHLTAGWSTVPLSTDADLLVNLDKLRARSRDLCNNNDHGIRFIDLCDTNIIGPAGMRYMAQASDGQSLDAAANYMLESAFLAWAKRGTCDVTGKLSFVDLQSVVINSVARDGEALVRRVRGRAAGNKYGYALQVLDVNRLHTRRNEELRGGNRIVMGVELTSAGRPVAYHLATTSSADHTYAVAGGGRYERVPASDIFHIFRPLWPEQTRGIPWMHSAMLRLNMLGEFETAALVSARRGAEVLGLIEEPDADPSVLADAAGGAPGVDPSMMSVPGSYDVLPPGAKIHQLDTKYPDNLYGQFVKDGLRGVSAGLGVSYNAFANDLEGVSFSTGRIGLQAERDRWVKLQGWFISAWLEELLADWLQMSLLHSAITYPTGAALPLAKLDKFAAHRWQGRRWQWVDPLKDVQAQVMAVAAGLRSRRDIVAEMGGDLDDVWEQLAAEQALAASLGINLTATSKPGANSSQTEDDQ